MNKRKNTTITSKLGNKIGTEKTTKAKTNGKKKEQTGTIESLTEQGKKLLTGGDEPFGTKETTRFFAGLFILIISLLMFLSFASFIFTGDEDAALIERGEIEGFSNYAGGAGAYCANYWMNKCFGFAAFMIPVFLLFAAMKLTKAYKVRLWKWFLNCTILTFWISITASFFFQQTFENLDGWNFINPGGNHGSFIVKWMEMRIGWIGTLLVIIFTFVCYLTYLWRETMHLVRRVLNPVDYIKSKLPQKQNDENEDSALNNENANHEENLAASEETELINGNMGLTPDNSTAHTIDFELTNTHQEETDYDDNKPNNDSIELTIHKEEVEEKFDDDFSDEEPLENNDATGEAESGLKLDIVETPAEEVANDGGLGALEPYDPKLDLENYHYPTLELLDKRDEDDTPIDMDEQNMNKEQIIKVLQSFGVAISSIKATVGPTITLYEITPDKGVRIAKIRNLEDDIALSLRALGIRIIAPIPGKGTIGIEVPNAKPRMVSMESILNSRKFKESEFELPIALGKTITNEVFMVDLAKMPHLLVAGATGQGKSVGLNAIITSLLYKKHPAELKFVMVDPKKVEFSIYAPIENHFLAKIADGDDEAIITDVQKVVATLKSLCAEMDTRYDLLKKARARNIKEYNAKFKKRELNPENGHRFMPYIVVVIDEFGDLIMTAGKDIELPIARIAQLARAVGIHMIIATQRPTTNIITGTIKANFPARMAFKVSAMIDSRTILDRPGANQLIGRGDMLFLSGSEPVRVQCAFVDTPEVERITSYIAKQQSYLGPFELPKVEVEGEEGGAQDIDMTRLDPLFEEAARLLVSTQQGSTSMIQRKFAIGYNRAGRLMDQIEKAGIVGMAQGSKPREVLITSDIELENIFNSLR